MALRSELFKDDSRLQKCLVSDPAHVTRGDVGDHVSRIQIALLRLGWGEFDQKELSSRTYGPTTAQQVLEFKRSFDIVNRSYQKTADTGPPLFMSGVQAKWPPQRNGHSRVGKLLGTVSASETAAPSPVRLKPCRATSRWFRRPEPDRLGQRGSTRKGHTLRGHQQGS